MLFAAAVLLPGLGQDDPQGLEEAVQKTQLSSFIRKDLLRKSSSEEDLQPPIRNIFSPRRSGSPGSGRNYVGADPGSINVDGTIESKEAAAAAEEEYAPVIDIRYIGYIRSQLRTVALVMFEGEAMAVKAGEIIADGVKIVKITPAEISYLGPDSLTKTVSLEGEDR